MAQNHHLQLLGDFFSPPSAAAVAGRGNFFIFPPRKEYFLGVLMHTEAYGSWTHMLPHGRFNCFIMVVRGIDQWILAVLAFLGYFCLVP